MSAPPPRAISPTEEGRPLLFLLLLLALLALPLLVTLRPVADPIYDPDLWWHLRVGQWVLEHRSRPTVGPFSRVRRPWVAYSWLYEVLLDELVQAFGLAGIVLYRAGMALAIVAALYHLVASREKR